MRIKRTTEEWATIIDQQNNSKHTVARFCREKGINQNVFYRKRKQGRTGTRGFIELRTLSRSKNTAGMIRIGKIEIAVEETMSDEFIVRLMRCTMEATNVVIS